MNKNILLLIETLEPSNFHAGIYNGFLAQKNINVIPVLIPRDVTFNFSVYDEIVLNIINKFKIDLLFSVQAEAIGKRVLTDCRRKNIKSVVWQVDDPYILTHARNRGEHISKLKTYSYIYTTNMESITNHYKRLGLNAKFMPFGYDSINHKNLNSKKLYDVSFVGSSFRDRDRKYIKPLKKEKTNIMFVGSCSLLWNIGRVGYKKMMEIVNETKINLNFADQPAAGVKCFKNRVTEIMGSGQFLLSEYFPEAEELFKIDKEIVLFNSLEELKNKINYYLKNDKEREKIAVVGHRKIKSNFSYKRLISKILEEVKI